MAPNAGEHQVPAGRVCVGVARPDGGDHSGGGVERPQTPLVQGVHGQQPVEQHGGEQAGQPDEQDAGGGVVRPGLPGRWC